jgi:hypothetical protein
MISTTGFAIVAALAVFGGGALGFILQRTLPESLTTGGPRDMIGAVVGLLTLLSAPRARPANLDCLRRLREPEYSHPEPRRESYAIRSRPR